MATVNPQRLPAQLPNTLQALQQVQPSQLSLLSHLQPHPLPLQRPGSPHLFLDPLSPEELQQACTRHPRSVRIQYWRMPRWAWCEWSRRNEMVGSRKTLCWWVWDFWSDENAKRVTNRYGRHRGEEGWGEMMVWMRKERPLWKGWSCKRVCRPSKYSKRRQSGNKGESRGYLRLRDGWMKWWSERGFPGEFSQNLQRDH